MKALLCVIVPVCLALACAPALAQKLYKHVDEKGVVTYTDLPDKPKDKPMAVGNTARNGDRTERANANLTRANNQSERDYQQQQQIERAQSARKAREEK